MFKFVRLLFIPLLFIIFTANSYGQKNINISWQSPIKYGINGNSDQIALNFNNAQYNFSVNNLPFFYQELETAKNAWVESIQLSELETELLSPKEELLINKQNLSAQFEYTIEHAYIKKERKAYIKLFPLRVNNNGQVERLVNFKLATNTSNPPNQRLKSLTFASNSALSTGTWYKIGISKSGVFKLNYNFLKTQLGIDIDNIDPRNISLFGYGGGTLPQKNNIERPDDLVENAIVVEGENDGKFDKTDYILFYGQGQTTWFYDSSNFLFRHQMNNYSDTAFYFISIDQGIGKRIQKVANPTGTATQVNTFDDYDFHEADNINLLKSGQTWYGEVFENQLSREFTFNFPNIDLSRQAKVFVSAAARSGINSKYTIQAGNQSTDMNVFSTVLTRYEVGYAKNSSKALTFNPTNSLTKVKVIYNKPQSVAKGWLDFIDINARRNLVFPGGQLQFRDIESLNSNSLAQFNISSTHNFRVWDVSNHFDIEEKTLIPGSQQKSFISDASILREYVAFNSYDTTNVFAKGSVLNQNLHGLNQADMIIISHPLFLNQANELKSIHQNEGLTVHIVTPQQIYNEFSSASQDPIAIRTFLKMFYDRAGQNGTIPRYALIIGDASYDFKDRINGNTNFVISYQSKNSLDPVDSYVSDDYFALLDDTEGDWKLGGNNPDKMDISMGRFPVQTQEEAQGIVNKIKAYYNKNSFGDWRNEIVFVGDDEDGVTHMSQSNQLAAIVEYYNKVYNLKKLFLDAFQQISTASGARYPAANEAIRRSVENGALIINYTGHGGETGWAHERILDISTITAWKNINRQPLFVTATCEFSRFDDPLRTSAGELVILNPNGGGIGLLTTTRLVYSSPNYFLNQTFYSKVFDLLPNGEHKRLGDIMLEVKNANADQGNTRNFTLLGDPALRLAIPKYKVITSSINGKPLTTTDTLRALSKATVSGYIADQNGQKITNFNGVLYPTIFDKLTEKSTLNNDGGGIFKYKSRESKIFKGKTTITNGDFTFDFIVPKDISYSFGSGKISYYAENGTEDGNGYTEKFIIGGSSTNSHTDEIGPEIEVYLNDASFIYGSITDENPLLYAKLYDEQGINTVGNGIGHDLVAIIDQNTDNSIILNDYYESEIDNYTKGEIRFQLEGLSEGKHTLTLKAWDNANNSSEKTIEFNVVSSKDIEIKNVLNYPNPFTTNTSFIFQHNQPGIPLDVKLEIFTVSGKLVKSIDQVVVTEGYLSRDIYWNGRDDYGDRIGKGVYVYKLKVRSRNGTTTEKFEKLVIL